MKLYVGTKDYFPDIKFTCEYPENKIPLWDKEEFATHLELLVATHEYVLTNSLDVIKYFQNHRELLKGNIQIISLEFTSSKNKLSNKLKDYSDNVSLLKTVMGSFYIGLINNEYP